MKSSATDIVKTPWLVKLTAIVFFSISVFFLANHFYSSDSHYPLAFSLLTAPSSSTVAADPPAPYPADLLSPPPIPPPPVVKKITGIIDDSGTMAEGFEVGDYDPEMIADLRNSSSGEVETRETKKLDGIGEVRAFEKKFETCDQSKIDYIPCLDNVEEIKKLNSTKKGEKFERHCPGQDRALNCVIPRPKDYRDRIPWPQSRDEVISGYTGVD